MLKTLPMRSAFGLMLFCLFLTSCSDGDLIVTSFNFEDQTLNSCGNTEVQVFYSINNENINETLSFKTNRTAFKNSAEFKKLILEKDLRAITNDIITPIKIQISTSNEVVYRTYNAEVSSSYFCNAIPPSSPQVLNEYKSVPGDENSFIQITTTVLSTEDDDNDTLTNAEEGTKDTDGDGIPDYLDIDDDGDNVLTKTELITDVDDPIDENGRLDTDKDGIPDYLDEDDDGDGVLTKLEITLETQFPTQNINDDGIPKYLDENSIDKFTGTPNILANIINIKYISTFTAMNIKFKKQGDNGEEISYTTLPLGIFTSSNIPTDISQAETEEPDPETTN